MLVKQDNVGTWFCCESEREVLLLLRVIASFVELPNEIINKHIKEQINSNKYNEIDFIVDGIDAQSAKNFVADMAKKLNSCRDENTEK